MIGKKYNRLTIIDILPSKIVISKNNKKRYEQPVICNCDCGNKNVLITDKNRVIHGTAKSCGCIANEKAIEQGHKNHKINRYDLNGKFGIGWTSNTNHEFYFDLEDYEKIVKTSWHETQFGYVAGGKSVRLHRHIMNITDKNIQVDHINNNKFDNRKCNLRVVSRSNNCMNKKPRENTVTGITGVYLSNNGKYKAGICLNGKFKHLGTFENFDDAVNARKEAEIKYFGKYSYDASQEYSKQYSVQLDRDMADDEV